jgi:hypothetical protein
LTGENGDNKKSSAPADEEEEEKRFSYTLALNLLLKLKQGDEHLGHDIVASFLFNLNFWSLYLHVNNRPAATTSPNFLVKYFDAMSLNDSANPDHQNHIEFNYLNVNVGQCETISISKRVIDNLESTHIYDSLSQIKLTYLSNDYLFTQRGLDHSRLLNSCPVSTTEPQIANLFTSSSYTNTLLVKPDWIYAPILTELVRHERNSRLKKSDESSNTKKSLPKLTSTVVHSLKFIYLMEMYFGRGYLPAQLSPTVRYARLLCVYLFDPDLFLDKQIVTYMYLIYLKLAKDGRTPLLESLDLNEKLDGMISFYDFYQHLLGHYDSVSFGDYVFSLYLIVPLQLRYPVKYRQLFWSDFPHLFKFARFDSAASGLVLPLRSFVHPTERALHMIRVYGQVLLDPTEYCMVAKSRLAYAILVASLNGFIFEHVESGVEFEFKKLLVRQFMSLSNQVN